MWLQAPNISCIHGFSDRHGGISPTPFNSLNLGGSDDTPTNIERNRQIALQHFNLSLNQLCNLKQVHGNTVCSAKVGRQEGDALVSNHPGEVLAISIADCYPILFYDAKNNVAGAAHAGWRGTLSGIAANVIVEMQKLGAETTELKVAVGQGISKNKFEVGAEVMEQFKAKNFPQHCFFENKIDLIACNLHILKQNNIFDDNIWTMNRCTFENDFYSYRRDKGITGRMWAMISLP